jgi:hypothetical protein
MVMARFQVNYNLASGGSVTKSVKYCSSLLQELFNLNRMPGYYRLVASSTAYAINMACKPKLSLASEIETEPQVGS